MSTQKPSCKILVDSLCTCSFCMFAQLVACLVSFCLPVFVCLRVRNTSVRMDGWMDGRTDGWMELQICICGYVGVSAPGLSEHMPWPPSVLSGLAGFWRVVPVSQDY